jgi:transcriptional regulator with PAS, ATPase and Fis domain
MSVIGLPRLMNEVPRPPRVLGRAPAMKQVHALVERLAPTNVTVVLMGETGTGKDVTAHLIHAGSPRAARPFVVFDCGSVPPNLMESELFGHERGAFTGAYGAHIGVFERARGGTVFLDELGELPLELQSRLLRVLDERMVRRVGGTQPIPVDVRVVAATNRDLAAMVAEKRFRRDLFFRIAAAVICLPPLRQRSEDIAELAQQLLADLGRPEITLTESAIAVLRAHSWPGNVRELKNALAYALSFTDDGTLDGRHFRLLEAASGDPELDHLPLGGRLLDTVERVAIKQTLIQAQGNKLRAARLLGIASSTLYKKMKKYGL